MNMEKYFEDFKNNVDKIYKVANEAKSKGYDPIDEVEIPIALSMAEKVVGLISTIYPQMKNSGMTERILELEEQYGKLDPTIMFKIADEISNEKFCSFKDKLEAIDAAIRIGFAYFTLGVVSSPIEGFTGIKVGKTRDNKEYLIANFSGPIRSAGTTASCLVLFLIDFLREKFNYSKYDPTEEEIQRIWTEISFFHERIANLQYIPSEEEALFIAKNLPIQIAGDPTEKIEVPNYKNLERVNTNFLRSGVCLVLAEGLAQKAPKGFRLYNMARKNGIVGTGFDWLSKYLEIHEKRIKGNSNESDIPVYMKDLVAGRPIFGHPSRSGSFRFRYGRSRTSGFSAVSIHPATMHVTNNFLANGTQLKIEKPTKGCVTTSCDSIEGPIVKLKSGEVLQLNSEEDFFKVDKEILEIIYLGDILFPLSDVVNRNSNLVKSPYVEEWWIQELKKKGFNEELDSWNVNFEKAIELSEKYKLSLYPKFIYYWNEISNDNFSELLKWLKESEIKEGKIEMPLMFGFSAFKFVLELLGIPHKVEDNKIIIDELNSKQLLVNLGIDSLENINLEEYIGESILERINKKANFEIRDKSGEFIGARMGRPEKAKLRKINGSPNSLFSIGKEGGRLKTFKSVLEKGFVNAEFPMYHCQNCNTDSIFSKCDNCGEKCDEVYNEKKNYFGRETFFTNREIDFRKYFDEAVKNLGLVNLPEVIKGVESSLSTDKIQERLEKGILRAKHNLQVNKDGTIRMDATELPLVSFKPIEIETSVDKLKELGYLEDIYGKELNDENQILELMPHDVLIPASPKSPDEMGDKVFIKICNFIDDLLVKFYKMEPYYNVKTREDLVGKLGVCMAPHNCAGVACRFIGFSKTLGIMASPYMHAAIRRDCDGDEMAIMLLGDVLLNFSRKFLSNRRGASQDTPLVMNIRINAGEVDDQILDFEYLNEYPIELYEKSQEKVHSSEIKINTVRDILREGKNPFEGSGFTHPTSNFNLGVECSAYKTLEDMMKKVQSQMNLAEKIRAVDSEDVARLVIEKHFIRDIRGNLRKFSMQTFRCSNCNTIFRRVPISGKCPNCKKEKIIFTVHEGGIKKYLKPALMLGKKYKISKYLQQTLDIVESNINSIFGEPPQKGIDQWL